MKIRKVEAYEITAGTQSRIVSKEEMVRAANAESEEKLGKVIDLLTKNTGIPAVHLPQIKLKMFEALSENITEIGALAHDVIETDLNIINADSNWEDE